jgi:hypothetical protein
VAEITNTNLNIKGNIMTQITIEQQAEEAYKKYGPQVEAYENFAKGRRVSAYEVANLGKTLDLYTVYGDAQEAAGNLSGMGLIPQVALDVITAASGASILPLVASMQTIPDQHSVAYFQQVRSVGANGGYAANATISDPRSLDALGNGTLGQQRNSIKTVTVAGTTAYVVNVPRLPLTPFTFELFLTGGVVFGKDDGKGNIMGVGVQGTINYATGLVNVVFAADPGASNFTILVDTDTDQTNNIDTIAGTLDSVEVRAEIFALRAETGIFSQFAFNQRFGAATDESAAMLTRELIRAKNTRAVQDLRDNVVGNTNFVKNPAAGISTIDHRMSFHVALSEAESTVHLNSGANNITTMIAGRTASAYLRSLPDFVASGVDNGVSVSEYGSWDGIKIVRATSVVADDEIICISNPSDYFNAPLVHAEYMPLFVTDTISHDNNPFRNSKGAADWCAFKAINSGLTTKITLT